MKKNIVRGLVFFCVTLVIGVIAINYHNKNQNETQIRTDIEPINNNFPAISDIENCYWYSKIYGKRGVFNIGPTSYKIVAFVEVGDNEKQSFLQEYVFTEESISFDDNLPISVLPVENPRFLYSADLEKKILGNRFLGKVFFDVDNGILYISAENL